MNMAVVTLFRLECCKLVYGNSVLEGFLQFENFLESLWVRTRLNVARLDNIQIGFLIWFLEVQKAFTHWENSKVKLQNTYELFDDKCVCLLNCGEYNLLPLLVVLSWLPSSQGHCTSVVICSMRDSCLGSGTPEVIVPQIIQGLTSISEC